MQVYSLHWQWIGVSVTSICRIRRRISDRSLSKMGFDVAMLKDGLREFARDLVRFDTGELYAMDASSSSDRSKSEVGESSSLGMSDESTCYCSIYTVM